jgi:hypothetical protein
MKHRTIFWLLLMLLAAPLADAQSVSAEEAEGAVISLQVQQELDRRLLQSDRQRYLDLLRRRRQASQNLDQLYRNLDEEYERLTRGDLGPEEAMEMQQRMAELELMVQQFEMEGDKLRNEAWLLRNRMREKGLRLAMLGVRIDSLKSRTVATRGALTGRWSITLKPVGVVGTILLRHRGTILSGEYTMGSERTGSLTGTVIGGRVTLQQIDAEYGKDAVYYGTLSQDGFRIEGTWETLNLASGRPGFGTWTAVRIPEEGEEAPPEVTTPPVDSGPSLPQSPPQNRP